MKVRIQRVSRRNWTWECHACHRGDSRNTHPDALAEAWAHVRQHLTFGFRGTGG